MIVCGMLTSCSDSEPDKAMSDSASSVVVPESDPGASVDGTGTDSLADRTPDMPFEKRVIQRYSYLTSHVPVADIDSIIHYHLKQDVQPRNAAQKAKHDFQAYMNRQESAVRKRVADEFGITVDSLEMILNLQRDEQ
jgi:hypothetical protein